MTLLLILNMLKCKLQSKRKKCYLRQVRKLVSAKNCILAQSSNKNTRKRCELCLKLTIKTERRHWLRSGVFIFSFVSIVDLEQVIVSWETILWKLPPLFQHDSVFCSICFDQEYNAAAMVFLLTNQIVDTLHVSNNEQYWKKKEIGSLKYFKVNSFMMGVLINGLVWPIRL